MTIFITAKARELGGNSADAYWNEFEETPTPETVGDWDSTAWGVAWHDLKDDGATDADYEACLAAWREGFFGEVL